MINVYLTKVPKLTGTDYKMVSRKARTIYKNICSKTKRKPYIRSIYFKKEKIFLDYFWQHLQEKNWKDRTQRLKYYPCAIDLIQNTNIPPISKENVDRRSEILHRFTGKTRQNELFFVQIKEEKRNGQKHLISVFPLR